MERINYESYKIPERQQDGKDGQAQILPQTKTSEPVSISDGMFYEIEYDSCPMPGVGKYVLKTQKIDTPEKDEIRELFYRMRDIAKTNRSVLDYSRFFDKRVHDNNARIFYKQGMFMKDFTDYFAGNTPFSSYFPYYQMMGYEQLRTYFTWRTEVRKGNVIETSLSYAFLYIYELLNNIGVDSPQEGLDQLMSFWKAFSAYNKTIDKYILRWLKDYHIYYELPGSFKEFVDKYDLAIYYPKMTDTDNNFDLFCSISKYDIRKSAFFNDDNVNLITDCFYFVFEKLRLILTVHNINFEKSVFQPKKKMAVWTPFKDALFYPWMKQPDRQIILSEKEIYLCSQNKWTFSTVLTTENSRQLIGYVMKQMESVLRKATKYKYKLSANVDIVKHDLIDSLNEIGLSLEKIVSDAAIEFYRETTKTVIRVDHGVLAQIRKEAFDTQEKLIVPEQDETISPVEKPLYLTVAELQDKTLMQTDNQPVPMNDVWESLKNALTSIEIEALSVVLRGDVELKKFADECGIMVEVLVDGINEKAMDIISDNLLDDEFVLYDDYKEQLKELVG